MNRIGRVASVALGLTLALGARASACLWDTDTLRAEASGLPDVLAVVTGRFERNPPLYYEVRLAHAEAAIAKDPDALAEYDDAGVACDRIGRGADAIRWMEKKAERLAAHPDDKEHAYRLHANLGTFLAHDWIRRGADRADPGEMKRGRDEIAEAIRINPDAHFGREKVQLAAMDWILDPPPLTADGGIPLLAATGEGRGESREDADMARGFAGLVALGNAWESVDVFHALAACFRDSANLRLVAEERREELERAGRHSMHPAAVIGDAGAPPKLVALYGYALYPGHRTAVIDWFRRARVAADKWNAEREAYMLPRLKEGRHPDWDPDFWDEFEPSSDADEPSQFGMSWAAFWEGPVSKILVAVAALVSLVVTISWAQRFKRRKPARRARPAVR